MNPLIHEENTNTGSMNVISLVRFTIMDPVTSGDTGISMINGTATMHVHRNITFNITVQREIDAIHNPRIFLFVNAKNVKLCFVLHIQTA